MLKPTKTEQARPELKTGRNAMLWDAAYTKIKSAILRCDLPPGTQITEQDLASELNVSRTPVHQAIVRLEQDGWVKLQPKRGVLISPVTAAEMRDIYEVLLGLEAIAVERLASRPADLNDPIDLELRMAAEKANHALQSCDLMEWAGQDYRFHSLLVERSGNPCLANMARTVMEKSHRARLLTLRIRVPPAESNKDHELIVDAIVKRSPASARSALDAHRRRGMEVILPILGEIASRSRFKSGLAMWLL